MSSVSVLLIWVCALVLTPIVIGVLVRSVRGR